MAPCTSRWPTRFPDESKSGDEIVISSPWLNPVGGSSTSVSTSFFETTVIVGSPEAAACPALAKCTIDAGAPHTRAPLPDDADANETPTATTATTLTPRPLINSLRAIIPPFAHRPAPCRADSPTIAHPLTCIKRGSDGEPRGFVARASERLLGARAG